MGIELQVKGLFFFIILKMLLYSFLVFMVSDEKSVVFLCKWVFPLSGCLNFFSFCWFSVKFALMPQWCVYVFILLGVH